VNIAARVWILAFLSVAVPLTANAAEDKSAQYEPIAPGIQVIRLWTSVGPEWPQVAVIEVSSERHHEFHSDPVKAFNKYKIFPQAVRGISNGRNECERFEEDKATGSRDPAVKWTIIATHSSTSKVT
jgi:hypothetical protein